MAAIGFTPSGAVAAENVRDLQRRASQGRRPLPRPPLLCQGQAFERAHDGTQRVRGDLSVARRLRTGRLPTLVQLLQMVSAASGPDQGGSKLPRERVRCVPSMFDSLGVKVSCPT